MDLYKLYPEGFPEQHKVGDVDIITLYNERKWDELDEVIICKDKDGCVTAKFGQDRWDLMPFARSKDKNTFAFSEFSDSFELRTELKLLAYGWLFNKESHGRKASAFTTIYGRILSAKVAYRYLLSKSLTTLAELSKKSVWENFKGYLINFNYSQSSLNHIFGSINHAIKLEHWLQISLNIRPIYSVNLAKELSDKEEQQTLVIPERISDEIFSKAIELINEAISYQHLIAKIEFELQANYLEGKRILDSKIKNGKRFSFTNDAGKIISEGKYNRSVSRDNSPQSVSDIISPLRGKIQGTEIKNGNDFQRYLGMLITSCYIVCGGFSGMRDSELGKLTPHSYYKDNFEGRDYHMLQSYTFKLGEKRETWITSSISEKAIELATTLTQHWRKEAEYFNDHYTNTLWVNQMRRSKPPNVITQWNDRLKLFCIQFNIIVTKEDFQECLASNPRSYNKVKEKVIIGQPWDMTTHQFRRTLAFYCIKNRLGTLVALKQQFKHIHLAMTEWYTNGGRLASLRDLKVDKDIQQALNTINAETVTSKIFKLWHSGEKLSGSHGKAIVKMRSDIPHIYSSWDVIYEAVKSGRLTLHGSTHSYCKSGYDCDMDGVLAPQFCVDCKSGSSIIDEQQAKWWQKKHKSLVAFMRLDENMSVTERSHYITQIRAAENVMSDFDMEFMPFEAELKVTEA